MPDQLEVFLYGYHVGELQRLATEKYVLRYDEAWANSDETVPLSLSLPLSSREHRGDAVSNFVDNLLPDNPAVRQRWAIEAGLSTVEPFALLQHYGEDVAGAVSFRTATVTDKPMRQYITYDEIALLIQATRLDETAWHNDLLPAPGQFSLGGAQSKFSLARHNNVWYQTTGSDASTHIFKPRVIGVPDGELVEYLVMSSAARLGIPTARVELFAHAGEHSLVVERFDRRVENGQTVRIHHEDLLQTLGMPRLRKFEKQGGPSIDTIARTLRATADAESPLRYAAMLIFSWLVLSTDAHAKNFSVFVEPNGARLAPLYDSSSILPYLADSLEIDEASLLERANSRELAVRYGASFLAGDVARFELDVIARACGIASAELLRIAEFQIANISRVMAEVAREMPSELHTDTIARAVAWMPVRARQAGIALGLSM